MLGSLTARFVRRDRVDRLKVWTIRHPKWRLRVYRRLASQIRSGFGYVDTIEKLLKRGRERKPNSRDTQIYQIWYDQMIHQGAQLENILTGWIPEEELLMIVSTEGPEGLERTIWYLEKLMEQAGTLSLAFAYPVLVVIAFFIMLYVVGTQAMPDIDAMKDPTGETGSSIFTLIAANAYLSLFPIAFLFILVRRSLKAWTGDFRHWLDHHLPPYTLFRRRQGNIFLFTYAAMVSGGTKELAALDAIAKRSFPWLAERVQAVAFFIRNGYSFGQALDETGFGFPDPEIIDDLVGLDADAGDMSDRLTKIALENSRDDQERLRVVLMVAGQVLMVLTITAFFGVVIWMFTSFNSLAPKDDAVPTVSSPAAGVLP